jgi:sporulation-control protein spo0M
MVFGSDMTIQAAVDRTGLHPGDVITVKVHVGGQPDQRVQGARVELACKNRFHKREREYNHDGPDHNRTVTREETFVAVWRPLPAAPDGPVAFGEHTVQLQVPPDAPPTAFEPEGFGSMVKWEVRAILDRRMGFDPDATIEVFVYSLPHQYAHWAQSPPVPKSHEVPMMLDQLSTRVLRPGEQITGVLTVSPRESAKGRAVRVQLQRRRTDTPDNMQSNETAVEVELARDVKLEAGQSLQFPFQIPLPEGVPPTFAAAKSYMRWYLEAVVDRKMRSDFTAEAEVVVYSGAAQAAGVAQPQVAGTGQPGMGQPIPGGQPQGGGFAQPGGMQLPGGAQPDPGNFGRPGGSQPLAAPFGPPGGAPSAEAQPGSFPADWYPDPWLHKRLRYWDGNAWTGHVAD